MKHPNEGALRRMADEPTMVRDTDRRHVESCARCHNKVMEMEGDARRLESVFAMARLPVDSAAALNLVRQRGAAIEGARRRSRFGMPRRIAPLTGGVAALLALSGIVALTPARSLAQSFITIFQPQQIQAVSVTSTELSALPDLRRFGTVHMGPHMHLVTYASRSALAAASGLQVMAPATLPAGVPAAVRYRLVPGSSASFQFSAARANHALAVTGNKLPAMPARIDGSTLRVTMGNTAIAVYGSSHDIPALVIGEMRAPRVTSTGTSVRDIEDYVLSLPGVPAQLAQQLRSINDPATTLPLLIPVDKAHSHPVDVQGVHGLAVGDNTGLGTVVVWEKNGVMHGVGGTMTENEALAVANSLT
ncbi:MAG: hypothetical protein NVSMB22_01810 [Chloroflexota bacterium]